MLTIIVVTGIQFGLIRHDAVKAGDKPSAADSAGMLAFRVGFEKRIPNKEQTQAERWILLNDTQKKATALVVVEEVR